MEETKLWLRNFKSLSDGDQMTHKPKMTHKLYNELIQIFQIENNELRNSAAKQLFDFNQETFMVFSLFDLNYFYYSIIMASVLYNKVDAIKSYPIVNVVSSLMVLKRLSYLRSQLHFKQF